MKLIDKIKMAFIKLPKPKLLFITDKMVVNKYRSLCNFGADDEVLARKKIQRMVSLAPYVYTYKNKKIYCFFDMKVETCIECGMEWIINIWRDRKNGYYPVDDLLKKKWAKVYGIEDNSKEVAEAKQQMRKEKITK